jgi:hypothetical protein
MFTALLRRIRRLRADGENGVAFITVLGLSAVLFALVGAGMVAAAGATTKSGHDNDWTAALDAAYAGVADYEARLTNDNTYQQYGNKNAPFSAATGSTSLVLPTDTNANPAFNAGADEQWSPVPHGSGNQSFRYEVDNSQYANTGTIRLLATGRSGDVTRSIVANVRQRGFIDYMYFTDYEIPDPQITGDDAATCTKYWYDGRNDSKCGGPIQFTDGDTLNGPIDSNDAMYICGGDFLGPVTTNYNHAPYYRDCGGDPTFATINGQTYPQYDGKLTMPVTNSQMLQETRGDLTTSTVPRPGCLYTGPTSITFTEDGKMLVYSPFTKVSNFGVDASGNNTPMPNTAQCGTPGTGGTSADSRGTLGTLPGATIDVPAQNLIYVQSEPASQSDPNYTPPDNKPGVTGTTAQCTPGGNALKNPLGGTYPMLGTAQPPTQKIQTTSWGWSTKQQRITTTKTTNVETPTGYGKSDALPYYGCRSGDAFVNGTVKGQVTVAADNFVYVTGDITYAANAGNILGLVGQNAVWVWNPTVGTKTTTETCDWNGSKASNCSTSVDNPDADSNYAFPGPNKNRVIDAAILSVAHTLQVQNYDGGTQLGNLTVLGAIAQKYRGTVGTSGGYGGGTGFLKDYTYDTRLRSIAPPKFLQAVSTTYGVTQFADVPAAYDAEGNPK